ncbi:MAG: DUF3137 domain-containing protein [Pedobacter sp.]|nr:MAG: DUF3137 domain-containing protein [Pedobacter sp.]
MPKKSQIAESFQSEILQLEAQRKSIASQILLYYGLGIICLVGMFIGFEYGLPLLITGFLLILFVGYKLYHLGQAQKHFKEHYKLDILKRALESYSPELVFKPGYGIGEAEFNNSNLFSQSPDRYYSEDYMQAKVGKTAFYFAEVHAEYKTVTHTKHGRQEHWHDIFKGILFVADFNKYFNGTTIVRPKDFSFNLSKWTGFSMFQKSSDAMVKLENPEFSKAFVCYSNDQVEARYILTPKLMEEIVELNARCNETISLSFSDHKVHIAFPLRNNYFDAGLYKNLTKSKTLETDLEVIDFVFQIIEDLDLNTRIWTKN